MENIKKLDVMIEEDNIEIQETYFYMLDKMMDAICLLRYEKNKECHQFSSIAEIYDRVLIGFNRIDRFNKYQEIRDLVFLITRATNRIDQKDEYVRKMLDLYDFFQKDGTLSKEITTPFFNEILNKQQDEFCKKEKNLLIYGLKRSLPLSHKCEAKRKRRMQIDKMMKLLKDGKSEELGLNTEEVLKLRRNLHQKLKSMKYFTRHQITFQEEVLNELDYLFFTDALQDEKIATLLKTSSNDVIKHLKNQYYKTMFPYIQKIEVKTEEIDRAFLNYDYNTFCIISNEKIKKNQEELLALMKEKKVENDILVSEENQNLLQLLPLVGLIEEFDMKMMLTLLKNSKIVMSRLRKEDPSFHGSMQQILNKFHHILNLSNIYNTDPIVVDALGEDVVLKIIDGDKLKSKDPKDYLSVYQKMLERTETHIPAISGSYQDYIFESGKMSDMMRLLMGHVCAISCLGPDGAGEEAYYQALTRRNADAIFIKEKDGEFVARSLLFRKGNYIVMAPIVGEKQRKWQLYNPEFLSLIADKIKEKAEEKNDRIDHIFLAKIKLIKELENYKTITDTRIKKGIPHCDIEYSYYLIATKEHDFRLNEEYEGSLYEQTREEVVHKTENFIGDIKRLKALYTLNRYQTRDKKVLEEEYYHTDFSSYQELYKGQDWYLAIKEDHSKEWLVLPTYDKRQQEEIEKMKETLEKDKFVKVKK